MKFRPLQGMNPADAYRRHGARYGFFVFAKVAAVVLNLVLGIITLVATIADPAWYVWCENAATITLKLIGATVPFLLVESLYWWYRLRQQKARVQPTA